MKAFSAVRVRLRGALNQTGRGPAGEAHMVICADSDAVIMALMFDPRADLTIDFGPRHGLLRVDQLRQRWLLQPLTHAAIDLGELHQSISGYTQVCCTTLFCTIPWPVRILISFCYSPKALFYEVQRNSLK